MRKPDCGKPDFPPDYESALDERFAVFVTAPGSEQDGPSTELPPIIGVRESAVDERSALRLIAGSEQQLAEDE